MSSHHHRQARRRLDAFVRAGYHALILSTGPARRMYTRLLHWVRVRSNLLTPIGDDALLQRAVGALASLARYHRRFVASPETWAGGEGNIYELIHSLAEHLLGRYGVPRCLANVWLQPASAEVRQAREWFIAHAQGQRFRAVEGLPMAMTRKMERLWLSSPHHLSLRAAMRRAELLALGAKQHLLDAVMRTRIAEQLEHGEFWRETLHWLVNHQGQLDADEIVEIVEFVDAQRFTPTTIVTPDRVFAEPPPRPDFSLAGRSIASLARLMDTWRRELAVLRRGAVRWSPSGLVGLMFRESRRPAPPQCTDACAPSPAPPERAEWRIFELLDARELRREGNVLSHCVSTYAPDCLSGRCSIWSLRRREPGRPFARRYTIEVDHARAAVVQVRGFGNRLPSAPVKAIIARWAELAGLIVAC